MIAIPGQDNPLALIACARADGSPIVAGTVNFYLYCLTGANAGHWWKGATSTWEDLLNIAGAGTHTDDGHWYTSIAAAAWTEGVAYEASLKESGDLHIPVSDDVFCTGQHAPNTDLNITLQNGGAT
ncbi:MAG: hypothetical protein IMZ55_11035 [Acidobacteria bacterium]|nr:hypothetical protein [Acidobacteriota bacterium]